MERGAWCRVGSGFVVGNFRRCMRGSLCRLYCGRGGAVERVGGGVGRGVGWGWVVEVVVVRWVCVGAGVG